MGMLSSQHKFFNIWNRKERNINVVHIGLMTAGGVCIADWFVTLMRLLYFSGLFLAG